MPTDPKPDDQPLTISTIEDNRDPLFILADRVIPHLGPDWEARLVRGGGVDLLGPDDMKIHLTPYGGVDYDPHWFFIGTYTATGRPHERVDTDRHSIFTLPSQIAWHLQTEVIPSARKRIAAARKATADRTAETDRRKALIQDFAERLDWNSSSFTCHSEAVRSTVPRTVGRRRKNTPAPVAPLVGRIGYDKNGVSMNLHFGGLPESLVEQLVDIVSGHFAEAPQQPPTNTDK